jgi:hypothetical protein
MTYKIKRKKLKCWNVLAELRKKKLTGYEIRNLDIKDEEEGVFKFKDIKKFICKYPKGKKKKK